MSGLRVHVVLVDRAGRFFSSADGGAPHTLLEPGESPVGAARRAIGENARWLGTLHAGADASGAFVILALASDRALGADTVDVPGGTWTLERARALDWSAAPPPEGGQTTAGAERRQLTVLFCDLVGSTALSATLDAEELRERIAAFQRACSEVIVRYHGFVARYMGDGLLAYFGYPQAWGDDAERAVRAGLAIHAAVLGLDGAQVRVGIATGDVVVGDVLGTGSAQERVVVGETPNLAARLQALASPGEVLLAPSTAALVERAFVLEDRGRHALKGFPHPIPVVRAIRPARAARRAGPFVGRERELDEVRDGWRRGGPVVLVGEAGVGKTGIVEVLLDDAPEALRMQASAWHGGTALHPVLESLRGLADAGALARLPATAAAIVTALLSGAPVAADREEVLVRLGSAVVQLAGESPLVVLEDAQWADSVTLALLERLEGTRVLVTQRPGPGWNGGTRLEIRPLDQATVDAWLAGSGVAPEVRARIVERAGGIPLYVQELTRLAASGGAEAIPVTLRDALAARLGRGSVRAVARSAAAFGGPFEAMHLEAIHPGAEPLLGELLDDGVLRRSGDGRYDFTHALLRDAAYETLLRRDRVALHGRIADVLERGDPAERAAHLDQAERWAESSAAWEAAARVSAQRFAPTEAAAAYGKALDAARRANAPSQRLVALGVQRASYLRLLEDYAATAAALDQAEVDGQDAGPIPELAQLWFHRGNLAFLEGDPEAVRFAQERSLALATEGGWLSEQARAWSGLGDAHYAAGDMRRAREAFTRCVELARATSLTDVQAANLPMVGLTSFFLNDVETAERAVREAVDCMAGGAHRGDLTAGAVLALCAHHRGVAAREQAEPILRRKLDSPIYGGFRSFSLSLVARTDDEALADVATGLKLVGEHRALGIRSALYGRRAAIARDPDSLAASLTWLAPPTPVFVRLLAIPHALHAARRLGDASARDQLVLALDELSTRGAPYAARLAAWARGGIDPELEAIFPP